MIDDKIERSSQWKIKVFILAALISFSLLVYPSIQENVSYLQTLKTARQLIVFLTKMRTDAILNKTPMEARFLLPDKVELFEVSDCGSHTKSKKISENFLSKWQPDVEFLESVSDERAQSRYCYDPQKGSSLSTGEVTNGFIFLAHHLDISTGKLDRYIEILIKGENGDLELGAP